MKVLRPTPIVVATYGSAFLLLAALSCGPPAPITIDAQSRVPPVCSQTVRTIRVSLSPDPTVPSSHNNSFSRVEWLIASKCATDPNQPRARQGNSCTVYQQLGDISGFEGGCRGPDQSPISNFQPVRFVSTPSTMSFDFNTTQGNICVRGRVIFSDGSPPLDLPLRTWRVELEGTPSIPDIGFYLRNTPTDPFPYPRSPSFAGCPDN